MDSFLKQLVPHMMTNTELKQVQKALTQKLSTTADEEHNQMHVDQIEVIDKLLDYMQKYAKIDLSAPLSTDDVKKPTTPLSACSLTTMNTCAEFPLKIFSLNSSGEIVFS